MSNPVEFHVPPPAYDSLGVGLPVVPSAPHQMAHHPPGMPHGYVVPPPIPPLQQQLHQPQFGAQQPIGQQTAGMPPGYAVQPPMPPGMQPLAPATPVVYIGAPTPQSSPYPVTMKCPHCNENIMTDTTKVLGTTVWLWAGALFCVCIFTLIPLCWIPLLCASCKDTKHSCPKCQRPIADYKRI